MLQRTDDDWCYNVVGVVDDDEVVPIDCYCHPLRKHNFLVVGEGDGDDDDDYSLDRFVLSDC